MIKRFVSRVGAVLGLGMVSVGSAMASSGMPAPDVSDAVTYIETNGAASISAIGGVLITLAALVLVYKWAKAALF